MSQLVPGTRLASSAKSWHCHAGIERELLEGFFPDLGMSEECPLPHSPFDHFQHARRAEAALFLRRVEAVPLEEAVESPPLLG